MNLFLVCLEKKEKRNRKRKEKIEIDKFFEI